MVIYWVVNERNKVEFEKKFQTVYGYSSSIPFDNYKGAVEGAMSRNEYCIVVKTENGTEEVVYRNK